MHTRKKVKNIMNGPHTCDRSMSREPEAIFVTAKVCIMLANPSRNPITKYWWVRSDVK
jgi:hypothetical protein